MLPPTMIQTLSRAETIDDVIALIPNTLDGTWREIAIAQAESARSGLRNVDLAQFCTNVQVAAKSDPAAYATLQAIIRSHVDA